MVPLVDIVVKNKIEDKIEDLRQNTEKIEQYFKYGSDKTIKSLIKFIKEYKIHVLTGYPREETQLPCIIVGIANENQNIYGIGDGIDENYSEFDNQEYNYLNWKENHTIYVQENTSFTTTLRIEVWSDNSIISSYLYSIAKYCLLSSMWSFRDENGFYDINLSGGDLEPAPEYLPIFIYRRAVMYSFTHDFAYPVENKIIGKEKDHFEIGTTIDDINIQLKGYENGK